MSVVVRIDHRDFPEIPRRVEAFARRVAETFPGAAVWAYGSFARGELHEGSDIDVVVGGDVPGPRLFDRIGRVMDLAEGLPVEPMVYTPAEFEAMRAEGNPFLAEVLRTGLRLV